MKRLSKTCLGLLSVLAGAAFVFLLLLQLVPFGRNHANPPVLAEPVWDSPHTRDLFMQACGDCHSNETRWPWYSSIAPVSWLVYRDVQEGREHFNVSEWGYMDDNEGEEAAEQILHGEMPLPPYLLTHPEARLNEANRDALVKGLTDTFGSEIGIDKDNEHGHEHEDG
jgi:mono/diheme cytochrome c family protein